MKSIPEILDLVKTTNQSTEHLRLLIDSGEYSGHQLVSKMVDYSWKVRYSNNDQSKQFAAKALTIATENEDYKGVAYARLMLIVNRFLANDNNEFLLKELIDLTSEFQKYHGEWGYFVSKIFTSRVYELLGEYENGSEYLRELFNEIQHRNLYDVESEACIASGNLFYRRQKDKNAKSKSVEKYLKALENKEKSGEFYGYAYTLDLLGRIYIETREYEKAYECFQNSIKIKEALKDHRIIHSYIGLAAYYKRLNDNKGVAAAYEKAFGSGRKRDKYGMMICHYGRGHFYMEKKDFPSAISDFEQALMIAKNYNIKYKLDDIYKALSGCYEATGDIWKALNYHKEFHTAESSREKQIFSFRQNYDNLHIRNQELMKSIDGANKIQKAMIPSEEFISPILPDHLFYFKPRNTVSGDFLWTGIKKDKIIIILADCTGHGVEGSFLSMLGIAYLGEIISKMSEIKAGTILNQLRKKIIANFSRFSKQVPVPNGMAMSVCIVDKKRSRIKIQCAGADSPIYLFRGPGIEVVENDKRQIGFNTLMKPYSNVEFPIKKGDVIYMSSDGYKDQLGGEKSQIMGKKRFRELLTEIHDKPFSEQEEILEQRHNEWKSYPDHYNGEPCDQTDDIAIFAFRI